MKDETGEKLNSSTGLQSPSGANLGVADFWAGYVFADAQQLCIFFLAMSVSLTHIHIPFFSI